MVCKFSLDVGFLISFHVKMWLTVSLCVDPQMLFISGMCVDVVSLGDVQSPLLQQAADITSGLYLKVGTPKRLLRTMMVERERERERQREERKREREERSERERVLFRRICCARSSLAVSSLIPVSVRWTSVPAVSATTNWSNRDG